jgi:hypothetical protein
MIVLPRSKGRRVTESLETVLNVVGQESTRSPSRGARKAVIVGASGLVGLIAASAGISALRRRSERTHSDQ